MSGHELSYTANRHFSIVLLNEAIADLVNAHARLDISQAWGDGTAVAADGTHMDTYLDNLLAETSVRYNWSRSGFPGVLPRRVAASQQLNRHLQPDPQWCRILPVLTGFLEKLV